MTANRRRLTWALVAGVALLALLGWWGGRSAPPTPSPAPTPAPPLPMPPPPPAAPAPPVAATPRDPLATLDDPATRFQAVRHIAEASGRTYVECPPDPDGGPGCSSLLCALGEGGSIAFPADQPSGALAISVMEPDEHGTVEPELVGRMVWETDADGVTTCSRQPADEDLRAEFLVVRPDGAPVPRVQLTGHFGTGHTTGPDGRASVRLLYDGPTEVDVLEMMGSRTHVWASPGDEVRVELAAPEEPGLGAFRQAIYDEGNQQLAAIEAALGTPDLDPAVEAVLLDLQEKQEHTNSWRREDWADDLAAP